jgi:hypothetical protein
MAQRVTVQLIDDLDRTSTQDVSTVNFAIDGAEYQIDLSEGNAEKLRDHLAPFVGVARRAGGRVQRGGLVTTVSTPLVSRDKDQARAIREWARQNGYTLSNRGRIPSNVIDAFDNAHAGMSMERSNSAGGLGICGT